MTVLTGTCHGIDRKPLDGTVTVYAPRVRANGTVLVTQACDAIRLDEEGKFTTPQLYPGEAVVVIEGADNVYEQWKVVIPEGDGTVVLTQVITEQLDIITPEQVGRAEQAARDAEAILDQFITLVQDIYWEGDVLIVAGQRSQPLTGPAPEVSIDPETYQLTVNGKKVGPSLEGPEGPQPVLTVDPETYHLLVNGESTGVSLRGPIGRTPDLSVGDDYRLTVDGEAVGPSLKGADGKMTFEDLTEEQRDSLKGHTPQLSVDMDTYRLVVDGVPVGPSLRGPAGDAAEAANENHEHPADKIRFKSGEHLETVMSRADSERAELSERLGKAETAAAEAAEKQKAAEEKLAAVEASAKETADKLAAAEEKLTAADTRTKTLEDTIADLAQRLGSVEKSFVKSDVVRVIATGEGDDTSTLYIEGV